MRWLEDLVAFSHDFLGDRERESLYQRGVSDTQVDAYSLGYLDGELPDGDYPQRFTVWWDKNRGQLDDTFVLPLTTATGQVGGLQFRHVQQARRGYTDYLSVKDEACLFGLAQAMPAVWETGKISLVEGVFDHFPVQRHLPYTVATLHAGISNSFWRVLRRVASEIYLIYDADKTGWEQALKIVRSPKAADFKTQIVRLPRVPIRGSLKTTKDPGELWEAWGDQRLGVFLSQQVNPQEIQNARF